MASPIADHKDRLLDDSRRQCQEAWTKRSGCRTRAPASTSARSRGTSTCPPPRCSFSGPRVWIASSSSAGRSDPATWEMTFDETHRPTLIRTPDGRSVPSQGSVWVMPGSGTILRDADARGFRIRPRTGGGVPPEMRVAALEMWLPAAMTEVYAGGPRRRGGTHHHAGRGTATIQSSRHRGESRTSTLPHPWHP